MEPGSARQQADRVWVAFFANLVPRSLVLLVRIAPRSIELAGVIAVAVGLSGIHCGHRSIRTPLLRILEGFILDQAASDSGYNVGFCR